MKMCLFDDELGSGYEVPETEVGSSAMSTDLYARLNQPVSGVRNAELRSLCIAAFLRCLFASIDEPSDFHDYAISNLSKEITFK